MALIIKHCFKNRSQCASMSMVQSTALSRRREEDVKMSVSGGCGEDSQTDADRQWSIKSNHRVFLGGRQSSCVNVKLSLPRNDP